MLSYRIVGKGEPILLIHGFAISFNIWRNIVPLLSKKFKLIIIELPGIGKSPLGHEKENYFEYSSDRIEELRKKLKIKKWSIVSYSVGSKVAECYLRKYKTHVEKAVFIFPLYVSKFKALLFTLFKKIDKKHVSFSDWILTGERMKFLIKLLGFNGKYIPEEDAWYNWISAQPISVLKTTLRHVPKNISSKLNTNRVESLFIWASRDMVTRKSSGFGNDVKLATVHGGIITDAGEIAKVINGFF